MASKRGKHYPVNRVIRLTDPTTLSSPNRRIEADRILSEANRRLYRQSKVYPLKIDLDINSPLAPSGIEVYVLNDTWDLHGAYKYAMKSYYNAMKEEMAISGGQIGRWHDFRVQSGVSSDLLFPVFNSHSLAEQRLDFGEHQYTQVVDSTGTSRGFGLQTTTSGTTYSIIDEWVDVDRVDDSPVASGANTPYSNLTDEIDDANRDLLQSEADQPPYFPTALQTLYRKVATLQVGPGGEQKLSTGFFDAPLGIVILTGFPSAGTGSTQGVQVTFQEGDYKGVKAMPYATPVKSGDGYEVV